MGKMGNDNNKSTISKYIESTYGELPAHSQLVSHHLNKMKESGELVFWKNNYTKTDPNAPPRRCRGRPPKPKEPLPPGASLDPVRHPGQQPKDPNAPSKSTKLKISSRNGKPRGQPRKMAWPTGGLGASTTTTMPTAAGGRGRCRPPKVKPTFTEVSLQY